MGPAKVKSTASITFDNNSQGPFSPGARISGRATFQSSGQYPIRSADVILFGHAITHGAKFGGVNGQAVKMDFADDSNLFRIQQPMEQDGAGSWKFDLRFPEQTGKPEGISPLCTRGLVIKAPTWDYAHILPPTFFHGSRSRDVRHH